MSTSRKRSGSPTSKKLSSCVRPGVLDVRASPLRLVSAFSSDDLPTLDRPAKATSFTAMSGRNLRSGADLRKAMGPAKTRSEEHTSELQSLMRISYAVFCLKQKKENHIRNAKSNMYHRSTSQNTTPTTQ